MAKPDDGHTCIPLHDADGNLTAVVHGDPDMSDAAREIWHLFYGVEPDLSSDLRFGQSQIPVLFDDRMALGEARLEEDPAVHNLLSEKGAIGEP